MMPTAFDEENGVLDRPHEMSIDECEPLSVWQGETETGQPVVISCWKPTQDELAEIQRTGRVWLFVFGRSMPPVALMGFSPFDP
jgi:hypothetical protein